MMSREVFKVLERQSCEHTDALRFLFACFLMTIEIDFYWSIFNGTFVMLVQIKHV